MNDSILVYSSIGDVSTFFPQWRSDGLTYAFNYYGYDNLRKDIIESQSDIFTHWPGTKFNLFSKTYDSISKFDYYVITDDDINIRGEDIINIVKTMKELGVGVASPSHSNDGRISWPVMATQADSIARESDFVEMTIVIFSKEELEKFLIAYIPYRDRMIGWGIDHIIYSVCTKPFLIFDNISVINPTCQQKGLREREIQTYINGRDPRAMWKRVLADRSNGFKEYKYHT